MGSEGGVFDCATQIKYTTLPESRDVYGFTVLAYLGLPIASPHLHSLRTVAHIGP